MEEKEVMIGPQWQEKCLEEIKDKANIILASPTGSGKTGVFLEWAKQKEERPIYITAPIKELSNQRWRELRKQGYVVGLETGDSKNIPENCDFICCTQEIYTDKYAQEENATLIIDEFHYIFENNERARTYIDALHDSKAKNILLCSATLGDLDKVSEYVDKVSKREFSVYNNKSRLTELKWKGKISSREIENALVVAFSKRNCEAICDKLAGNREFRWNANRYEWSEEEYAKEREERDSKNQKREEIAQKYKIDNSELEEYVKQGIAYYYGNMLPKEKLFIGELFEEKLLDTVVGTDALAMGVNFPIKNVVFAQLAKYQDGPISKNLFDQLAGRAGRKGYFDEGNVWYCDEFTNDRGYPIEARGYRTKDLFYHLLAKENESVSVNLLPKIKDILQGEKTMEEEAEYIVKYSTGDKNFEEVKEDIERNIDYIQTYNLAEEQLSEIEMEEMDLDNELDERAVQNAQDLESEIYFILEKFQKDIQEVRQDFNTSEDFIHYVKNYTCEKELFAEKFAWEYEEIYGEVPEYDDMDEKDSFQKRECMTLQKAFNEWITENLEDFNTLEEMTQAIAHMDLEQDDDIEFNIAYKYTYLDDFKKYFDDLEVRRQEIEKLKPLQEEFHANISNAYFSEFDVSKNCELFADIVRGLDSEEIIEKYTESFSDLLQFRKYVYQLPKQYRKVIDIADLEESINSIDETALDCGRGNITVNEIRQGTKQEQLDSEAMRNVLSEMKNQMDNSREQETLNIA